VSNAHSRPKTRRLQPGIPSILIVAVIIVGFSGVAHATGMAAPPSSACSPVQLSEEVVALDSTVNGTLAMRTALESQAFQRTINAFPPTTELRFTSMFESWNFSNASCTVVLTGVNLVFTLTSSSGSVELSVTENPAQDSVIGVTATSELSVPAAVTGQWNGYAFSVAGSPAYGDWYVPSVTWAGGHCGGGLLTFGFCEFLTWVGQTVQLNGGNGISQAGSAQEVACTWIFPTGWDCGSGYEMWYQFVPTDQYIVPCSGVAVHPGDLVSAESSYNATSNLYTVVAYDYASSNGCSSFQSMSMGGPPVYGDFIAEDPVLNGGNPTIPNFSPFTISFGDPLGHYYPGGVNDLAPPSGPPSYLQHQNPSSVSLTAPFYGVTEPPGVGNCLSYTCVSFTYV